MSSKVSRREFGQELPMALQPLVRTAYGGQLRMSLQVELLVMWRVPSDHPVALLPVMLVLTLQ